MLRGFFLQSQKTIQKRHEKFINKSIEKHGEKYDYSEVDKEAKLSEKTPIICPEHGRFYQTKNNHMNGQGCYECSLLEKSRTRSKDQDKKFFERASVVHNDWYDYSCSVYKSNKEKLTIICPDHGKFEQTPNNHLAGSGCPSCAVNQRSQKRINSTKSNLEKRLRDKRGDYYDYDVDSYDSNSQMLTIICPEHGPFKQTISNHMSGQDCPQCSHRISKCENEIIDFIRSIGVTDIVQNDRTIVKPKEVDIYLPSLRLGIEFNGLHFHSEYFDKDKRYHLTKTEECEEQGIRLIHIYEDEWMEKKDRLKEFLTSIIAPKLLIKRNARALALQVVSNDVAREFLNRNHIQGYKGSTVKYGLFEGATLVSYIGLSERKDGWHIDRFSSIGHVRGGFSKLLKHFKRHNQWNRIVSFADRRYSQGKVYKTTGFHLECATSPGYDYEKNRKRFSRTQFMKHKLSKKLEHFDPSLTECENMSNNGYYRIWNCGMLKFVMTND